MSNNTLGYSSTHKNGTVQLQCVIKKGKRAKERKFYCPYQSISLTHNCTPKDEITNNSVYPCILSLTDILLQ